jgi:tRNA isopentenyl-2-thiomethyl-A-37 hydroxylase MiaE
MPIIHPADYDELAEMIADREALARRIRKLAAMLAELDDAIDALEAEHDRVRLDTSRRTVV